MKLSIKQEGLMVVLIFILLMAFTVSCHKDETYACYLIDDTYYQQDTISNYHQGFIRRMTKPEEECHEDEHYFDSIYPYNTYYCSCQWEDD